MTDVSKKTDSSTEKFPVGTRVQTEPWGTITLEVSDDAMKAVLTQISPEKDTQKPVTPKMFYSALKEMNIINGILPKNIVSQQKALFHPDGWSGGVVIAQGTQPKSNRGIDFKIFEENCEVDLESSPWKIGETQLSFVSVQEFFSSPGLGPASSIDSFVAAANAGEIIAVLHEGGGAGEEIAHGKDIYSRDFFPPEGASSYTAGDNVTLENDTFTAECYGLLMVIENCISILPPVKIREDHMEAVFYNLEQCQPVRYPSQKEITDLLELAGVTFGVLLEPIAKFAKIMPSGAAPKTIILAKGKKPVPGNDAKFTINKPAKKTDPEKETENGSVDFHELDLFHSVSEDELVAVKQLPTSGVTGQDIFEEDVKTTDGQDIKINPKGGIRVEVKGTCQEYYAETGGVVNSIGGDISVDPICVVNGDVDFSVGNLDVDEAVHISGSVLADFHVKAKGNAQIDGMLEPGAKLEVHGDAEIKQGIIGENTEVIVHGNLSTSYIQDAAVTVKGDLFVQSHIFNADITTGGNIIVEGKGSGKMNGSIAGGTITSSNRIIANQCGSPSNVETHFTLQVNPEKTIKQKKINEAIKLRQENISKIMRTLGIDSITKESIGALMQTVDPKKHALYIQIIKKLNIMAREKDKLVNKQEELNQELKDDLEKMAVIANNNFFGACHIVIGLYTLLNSSDIGPSKFELSDKEITRKAPSEEPKKKSGGIVLTGKE